MQTRGYSFQMSFLIEVFGRRKDVVISAQIQDTVRKS